MSYSLVLPDRKLNSSLHAVSVADDLSTQPLIGLISADIPKDFSNPNFLDGGKYAPIKEPQN